MGAVQPTGRYRRFRRHDTAPNNIIDDGWQGGGEGGRGLRTSNVVTTHGGERAMGVVATQQCFVVVGPYVSEKVLSPYDIKMGSY